MKGFQISGATVPGMDHIMPGMPGWKNNQDAFAWQVTPNGIVAVVCDGCGSQVQSEIGAQMGARVITNAMSVYLEQWADTLSETDGAAAFCRVVMDDVLARINTIAKFLTGNYKEVIETEFLFSTVGFVLTPKQLVILSCGDGVYAVNDEVSVIGPFPGNEPPYLAYNLLSTRRLDFTANVVRSTADVQSVLIGTDGVSDLMKVSDALVPGHKEPVGPLSQFWRNPEFFDNSDMVRRRLAQINRETVVEGRIKRGLLRDDTTLVTLRRKPLTQGVPHA